MAGTRTASPSGDSFALPPAPPVAVPASPSSQDFAAGMQAAQAQSQIVIDSLRAMLADTRQQLTDTQQRLRDDRDDHQKALQRLETDWRTRLDEMRDKLADERNAASGAKQDLAIEKLRAELTKTGDSSIAERMLEPLLGAVPQLAAAFAAQPAVPQAAPVYTLPPAAPTESQTAPPPPAPAAPPAPTAPAEDPAAMAQTLLSRFESGVLSALTDAIRAHGAGGEATGGQTAVLSGLSLLQRAGITPPAGLFARVALNAVVASLNEGQAARSVAAALAPVVAVAGQAGAILKTLTPEAAADTLGALAGTAIPPEMRDFLVEVVGYVAQGGDTARADSPIDAGVINSTAPDGAQTADA